MSLFRRQKAKLPKDGSAQNLAAVTLEQGAGHPLLPPGDNPAEAYKFARNEWDNRIGDAVEQRNWWRYSNFGQMMITAVSVAGVIYFASQNHIVPMTIIKDKNGDVLDIRTVDRVAFPMPMEISADLRNWLRNARTIDVSVQALKNHILRAYAYTAQGSIAFRKLEEFHLGEESGEGTPFERATKKIVEIENQTALPVSETPDSEGRYVWQLHWDEVTRGRDGTIQSRVPWRASVTFVIATPTTAEQVAINPDGLYVVNFTWTPEQVVKN